MNHFNKIVYFPYKIYKLGGGQIISTLLYRFKHVYYHCDISYTIDLTGVHFNHKGLGVAVNPQSKIGRGSNIQHSVTIGENKGCSPIIGQNENIGAKDFIIVPVKIGEGASTLVNKSVPDGTACVGVPGRI